MQPRQKLRLLALAFLIPFLGGLAYFAITGRKMWTVPTWAFVVAGVYLGSAWITAMAYMLRHREELRDPPEVRERQRQQAFKKGPSTLNVLLVIYVACDIAGIFSLRSGHLDARRTTIAWITLIASVPAMALLLWTKRRLQSRLQKKEAEEDRPEV
jgi:membrane protein implicated in regulation of membrane protease activity